MFNSAWEQGFLKSFLKRAVYGAAYEYSFAKNVIAYVAVNYSDASGAGSKVDDASAKDTVQGFLGMSYLF